MCHKQNLDTWRLQSAQYMTERMFILVFLKLVSGQKKAIEGILKHGLDGSQAMKFAQLTDLDKVGEHDGLVGTITKGRTNRTEYNKSAVMMALVHLENPEHY